MTILCYTIPKSALAATRPGLAAARSSWGLKGSGGRNAPQRTAPLARSPSLAPLALARSPSPLLSPSPSPSPSLTFVRSLSLALSPSIGRPRSLALTRPRSPSLALPFSRLSPARSLARSSLARLQPCGRPAGLGGRATQPVFWGAGAPPSCSGIWGRQRPWRSGTQTPSTLFGGSGSAPRKVMRPGMRATFYLHIPIIQIRI